MKTSSDRIAELNAEIEAEKRKISNCKHEFGETYDDYENKLEYTYETRFQGSDSYPAISGSYTKTIPRWARKCKLCGLVQHTYTKKTVRVIEEPDFK